VAKALQGESGSEPGIQVASARPKDGVFTAGPVAPELICRWLGIAGARLGLHEIRSIGRGRVGDGQALVGRDRLDDESTCKNGLSSWSGPGACLERSLHRHPILEREFLVAIEIECFKNTSFRNKIENSEVTRIDRVAFASTGVRNTSGAGEYHGDASKSGDICEEHHGRGEEKLDCEWEREFAGNEFFKRQVVDTPKVTCI